MEPYQTHMNTENETPSSDSYAVSPVSPEEKLSPVPVAIEAATSCNGLDHIDNKTGDTNHNYHPPNGNIVDVHIVSESSHSIDVLSGGESDQGDTLSRTRLNNNSISSCGLGTLRDGTMERIRRRAPPTSPADTLYYITKELLLTERTYKSDLEVVTVWWSGLVSELVSEGQVREEALEALGRPCLALEPLAVAQAAFLAHLERVACSPQHREASDEPEFHQVVGLLHDYLKNTYDAYWCYVSRAGALVARLESARRSGGASAAHLCAELEARSLLPLAHHLLRPLHRLLHYRDVTTKVEEMSDKACGAATAEAREMAARLADAASSQLQHAENHALLCQLQRDLNGFDKLLVPEREFVRLGVLYKLSSKGLQQRMFFLFSDILVCCSKAGGGVGSAGGAQTQQFRVHSVLPLCRLTVSPSPQHLDNAFILQSENVTLTVMAGDEAECVSWCEELRECAANAQLRAPPPTHPTLPLVRAESAPAAGLAHVCWHRATTLTKRHYHLAMKTQLSGYLLRKFKNSHGWQKLWVVLATATLFFYKGWHEEQPLASLPLLGYSVSTPTKADNIHKEYVFKLLFKNHVYFFRAESEYTFSRWTEELQAAMGYTDES